jgi:(R,R)-butanediol dehydrogenase / meso-butanediol dehydrogenase / diacetyl reductase
VALHAVRRGSIAAGETVALMGIGGIGAFVLAAAARRGGDPLIAIDIEEQRLETARRLGATHVVNAREADPAKAVLELSDGVGADAVIEASGAASASAAAFRSTRRGGRVVLLGLHAEPQPVDLADLILREVDVVTTAAHVCDVDLPEAIETLATTPLAEVVVDRVIDLEALVPDGLEALAEGSAKGKVLVDPSG